MCVTIGSCRINLRAGAWIYVISVMHTHIGMHSFTFVCEHIHIFSHHDAYSHFISFFKFMFIFCETLAYICVLVCDYASWCDAYAKRHCWGCVCVCICALVWCGAHRHSVVHMCVCLQIRVRVRFKRICNRKFMCCQEDIDTLQHIATHCNALQHRVWFQRIKNQ